MTLKYLIDQEVRKIRETAMGVVIELKLDRGQGQDDLVHAIYLEYEFWIEERQPWNRAQAARFRCLEALGIILDVRSIRADVTDWIRQMDRSAAVLRRDVAKAAPAPDSRALRAYERADQAARDAARKVAA
jgi:hypothetical protein